MELYIDKTINNCLKCKPELHKKSVFMNQFTSLYQNVVRIKQFLGFGHGKGCNNHVTMNVGECSISLKIQNPKKKKKKIGALWCSLYQY